MVSQFLWAGVFVFWTAVSQSDADLLRDYSNHHSLALIYQRLRHIYKDIRPRPVQPTQISRIIITEDVLEKVGLVLEYACISVCVCICAFATPAGWGPWTTLTRAIKVYKREAQLSIKLTDCPYPTLL